MTKWPLESITGYDTEGKDMDNRLFYVETVLNTKTKQIEHYMWSRLHK